MTGWRYWVLVGLLAANLGLVAGTALRPVAQWWFGAMAQALGEKEATIILQRTVIQRLQQELDQARKNQEAPGK